MASPTASVENPAPPWKRVALSGWTVAVAGLALTVLHAWWFVGCRAMPRAEVVGGYGAAVTALGVFVASRPYIRAGIAEVARAQVSRPEYPGYFGGIVDVEAMRAADHARVEAAKRDVIAERIVAVLVAVLGALMNGYSGPIARALALIPGLGDCA